MMMMIRSIVSIIPYMFVLFTSLVIIIPLIYMMFSYLNFVGKGHSFNEYNWRDDDFLVVINEFYISIEAYNKEDRLLGTLVIIGILSVFWVVGVPLFLYLCSIVT